MSIKVAPSILSANFAKLGEEISLLDQTDCEYIHFDVMDYHYVPNLTFGPMLIKSVREYSKKVFDVHLMISNPELYVDEFKKAGADIITFHYEATTHHDSLLQKIKDLGAKAGIALNPSTPHHVLEYLLDKIDQITVMTVNPGFGGQFFLTSQLNKIKNIKKMISGYDIDIEIDGGVNQETAISIKEAGANVLVAGSYIFKSSSYSTAINKLKSI